jgi:hypothetical protein
VSYDYLREEYLDSVARDGTVESRYPALFVRSLILHRNHQVTVGTISARASAGQVAGFASLIKETRVTAMKLVCEQAPSPAHPGSVPEPTGSPSLAPRRDDAAGSTDRAPTGSIPIILGRDTASPLLAQG